MSQFNPNTGTTLPSATMPTYPPPSTQTTAAPTRVDTAPQQASTSPGDGSEVHTNDKDLPNLPGTGHTTASDHRNSAENVSFKERVVGAAQKTRGTIFGDSDLKQHGQAIIDGRTTFEEDRKH